MLKIYSLYKVKRLASSINKRPKNPFKDKYSFQIKYPNNIDQNIRLYSYGAIVDGEPILYAPKREKKPITPVKPMTNRIKNDE